MNIMEFNRRGSAINSSKMDVVSGAVDFRPESMGRRAAMLMQYLSIAKRRKWIIVGAVAGAVLIGLLITLLMTPLYTASATLEIQRESRNFINVEGAQPEETSPVDLEFYQTQYGLLRARSLAERVAADLRAFDDPRFFEMFGRDQADTWFKDGKPDTTASTREERIRKAGDILLENLEVAPERLSRLVTVRFTSPDAAFSEKVVDAWTSHFIETTLERRFEATSYARKFLEQRLTQLRDRIDESERRLVSYAARQGIVNLPASTPSTDGQPTGERSLVADDLVALNGELAAATADRVRAQSRLSSGGVVTETLENPAIAALRERRAELAADYAKMMVQFEPDYPPARALQTQIQQLDRSIGLEENRVQNTLRETYKASIAREENLTGKVNELKSGMLDLRRRSIQYNIFKRDVDTNRQLYDALLQRYKEIGVAGGVGINNISVVDEAQLPQRPSSPKFLLNMALALLSGLVVGVSAALALEQIDQGIKDPSEVEENLRIPLLGTIPKISNDDPLQALQDRKSPASEAYMSLQTTLAFSTDHGVPRTLAVTSTRASEGKSTTSYALARSLARSGRRTLLVDADMRSPSVHGLLQLDNSHGLSTYLAGSDNLTALVKESPHENLFMLSAGPRPPSAAELLSSDRVGRLISELQGTFDYVVFDAPPVMGLADAPLIASKVEATIFVVESHGTHSSMAEVAIGRLRMAQAQIVGAVLTKFDSKRAHYGYGYDYGYGYGYGDRDAA